jgi:hypothetical protein
VYGSFFPLVELEPRLIIRFLFKEDVEAQDIHRQLSAQFDDAASSQLSMQRWCQALRPRSGRPSLYCLDIQILSSLEKLRFHSTNSRDEILKVSYIEILNHLSDAFRMKHFDLE